MTAPQIGFQGVAGAYSEEAAAVFDEAGKAVGHPTFDALFAALDKGVIDHAVLPLENSTAGVVQPVSDLLWEYEELTITAEIVLPIRHHLLGFDDNVSRAISHPQALAQCAGWLAERGIEAVPFFDTAGSAEEVARSRPARTAAIAGARAAERYGLRILAANISDLDNNQTRFGIARRGGIERPLSTATGKISLGLAAEHRPGGLVELLQVFAAHGVNLTRLDSRPSASSPFTYRFYVDGEFVDNAGIEALLGELELLAATVRVFGVFAGAAGPSEG